MNDKNFQAKIKSIDNLAQIIGKPTLDWKWVTSLSDIEELNTIESYLRDEVSKMTFSVVGFRKNKVIYLIVFKDETGVETYDGLNEWKEKDSSHVLIFCEDRQQAMQIKNEMSLVGTVVYSGNELIYPKIKKS